MRRPAGRREFCRVLCSVEFCVEQFRCSAVPLSSNVELSSSCLAVEPGTMCDHLLFREKKNLWWFLKA